MNLDVWTERELDMLTSLIIIFNLHVGEIDPDTVRRTGRLFLNRPRKSSQSLNLNGSHSFVVIGFPETFQPENRS